MNMDELLAKVEEKLANLITLEIVTAVGPVAYVPGKTREEKGRIEIEWQNKQDVLLSRINLLEGDILTVIPGTFADEKFETLRKFHLEREKDGLAIIKANIAALRELYDLATHIKNAPKV